MQFLSCPGPEGSVHVLRGKSVQQITASTQLSYRTVYLKSYTGNHMHSCDKNTGLTNSQPDTVLAP